MKCERSECSVDVVKNRFCSKSCQIIAANTLHGHASKRGKSREYSSYSAAKRRCNDPGCHRYSDYGARGIEFRWGNFVDFLRDMGPRPPNTSLDRIDVNGHYEPGNCRWATASEQRRNRRLRLDPHERIQVAWLQRIGYMAKDVGGFFGISKHYAWRIKWSLRGQSLPGDES